MLKDKFLRKLDYLRVSVTDKCNLRCGYCMPSEGVKLLRHDDILRNEEFVHFIGVFSGLGIKKIRFTGGEPLLRKGFIDIVKNTHELYPDMELCLTTNGIFLDTALDDLLKYRVEKINISLDSVSGETYKKITGYDHYDKVMSNILKTLSYNFFKIKINIVLMNETLNEIDDLLEFFKDRNVSLRFIERMPFVNNENHKYFPVSENLINRLKDSGTLSREAPEDTRVAMMYDFHYKEKYKMKIGIIPPLSHNFCADCNRLRLTCDGFLKTCLHSTSEYDLKSPYRMDMGDEVLKGIIIRAVGEKPKKHNLNNIKRESDGCSSVEFKRSMSKIGG